MTTKEHPQWLDRNEYPFAPNSFDTGGAHMHYVDEGSGDTLLFVHGTPSWSFDFRKLIVDLSRDHRCVAPDHIGFGLSDKPAQYGYGTSVHADNLERLVLEKDLKDIKLILHDFGGPIGMSFALRHPERIRQLVIMNSWLWNCEDEPSFIRMKKILRSPLLPFLYRRLNFSPRFILPRSFGSKKPGRHILNHYIRPFGSASERNGALAFAQSLLNDQDWFESLWKLRDKLAARPILFIWGMKDPVIPVSYLHRFMAGFPGSSCVELPECGHFPQEEEGERTAAAIRSFLQNKAN